MLKKIIAILIITCASVIASAQVNLVKNGGFEQYSLCPDFVNEIGFANYWSGLDSNWGAVDSLSPTYAWCLPEYCNVCSPTARGYGATIPINQCFYQWPRNGNGFAQVRMLVDTSISHHIYDYRDYLQGRLSTTLTLGKTYCVTFYADLANESSDAIDQIGAYFDNGAIDGVDSADCPLPKTMFTPQVVASSVINDTENWVKIQGSIIATGNEKFITIGNFADYAHTNKIIVNYSGFGGGGETLYLIDDVSVIASDAIADAGIDTHCALGDSVWIGTTEQGMPCTWYVLGDTSHPIGYGGGMYVRPMATGTYYYVVMLDLCGNVTWDTMRLYVWPLGAVSYQLSAVSARVYPNPAASVLYIDGAPGCSVVIYNVVGNEVYEGKLANVKEIINIDNLVTGVYFVEITDGVTGYRVVRQVLKE